MRKIIKTGPTTLIRIDWINYRKIKWLSATYSKPMSKVLTELLDEHLWDIPEEGPEIKIQYKHG